MSIKYISKEALESQIEELTKQINKIGKISGKHLGYDEASAISHNLGKLREEYRRQLRKMGE